MKRKVWEAQEKRVKGTAAAAAAAGAGRGMGLRLLLLFVIAVWRTGGFHVAPLSCGERESAA